MVKFRNKLRKSLVLKEIIETCDISHRICNSNMREKMSEESLATFQGDSEKRTYIFPYWVDLERKDKVGGAWTESSVEGRMLGSGIGMKDFPE